MILLWKKKLSFFFIFLWFVVFLHKYIFYYILLKNQFLKLNKKKTHTNFVRIEKKKKDKMN